MSQEPKTSGTPITIGPLPQDAQDYLARLRQVENHYDPNRLVGGTRKCPRCGKPIHAAICSGDR